MSSGISFSGVGSGIDFNTIRDAIIASRSRPATQLQGKAANYNSRIDALKQLNAALANLTGAAQNLTDRSLGTNRTASVADATVATASATGAAALGQIDLNVTRLATSLSQASRSFASVSAPVLTGGATTATFELRKGGASAGAAITIDENNNSLAGLRDAINAANAGITASIVDLNGDGAQQLVLNSTATGASGRVELVETSATGTAADLNLRSLNLPDNDFAKLDAAFTLNNLSLTRPTNTIADAVAGVTLDFKKTGATSVNVIAAPDIENKLRAFVNNYNAVQDFVAAQYQKDGKGRPTGVLAGDTAIRAVQQQLRDAVRGDGAANGGSLKSLAEIGVTADKDGKLALDTTVLNDKLKTNGEDVRALLFGKTAADAGVFKNFYTISNGLSDAATGAVQTAVKGYQSSIESINNTVARQLDTINRLRDSLTKQFAAADAAIGTMNSQNTSLTNIFKSLQSNKD